MPFLNLLLVFLSSASGAGDLPPHLPEPKLCEESFGEVRNLLADAEALVTIRQLKLTNLTSFARRGRIATPAASPFQGLVEKVQVRLLTHLLLTEDWLRAHIDPVLLDELIRGLNSADYDSITRVAESIYLEREQAMKMWLKVRVEVPALIREQSIQALRRQLFYGPVLDEQGLKDEVDARFLPILLKAYNQDKPSTFI